MRSLLTRLRSRDHHVSSTRYRIVVASMIALTALVGALSAWRAEAAAMKGENAERKGFADSVANEQEKAQINSNLEDALFNYERAQSYFAQAKAFRKQAAKADGADAARLEAQAKAQESLGNLIMGYIDKDTIRPNGSLDLAHKFDLEYTLARSDRDLDPTAEFHVSDAMSTKSERLVGLTALLVAAAFFFTLGQISRRATKHLYVGGGLTVLITAGVLFALVEAVT